jgi:hypothetical protein
MHHQIYSTPTSSEEILRWVLALSQTALAGKSIPGRSLPGVGAVVAGLPPPYSVKFAPRVRGWRVWRIAIGFDIFIGVREAAL